MRSVSRERMKWNLGVLPAALLAVGLVTMTPALADAPPDAVIELWEQSWTLHDDGTIEVYEKKHTRLNSDRVYHEFADPRITYNADTDELEVITARVLRPDASYRALPEYGHVLVSPDASQGWPAFAGVRQHLLVMSGIEPGCVMEVEYRIKTRPGVKPGIAGNVRIDADYPVKHHRVTVSVPAGHQLNYELLNAPDGLRLEDVREAATGAGHSRVTETFVFRDLPAVPHEPQRPRWQAACPRFVFSSGPDARTWLDQRYKLLADKAQPTPAMRTLVEEWTASAKSDSEQLRAIQEQLATRFNFVDFPTAWQPAEPRAAGTVLTTNYGLPMESAVLLLALARAADLDVAPGLLARDEVWCEAAPHAGLISDYVVVLSTPAPEHPHNEVWHPQRGRIQRDAHWAGYTLLSPLPPGHSPIRLAAWTDANDSVCEVRGDVALCDAGKLSGTITIDVSGLFVSPENLRTQSQQKARLTSLLHHVLPAANIHDYAVTRLSDDRFAATVDITSDTLDKIGGAWHLPLAEQPPVLSELHLPLESSTRHTPVALTGPCDGVVHITISWPEDGALMAQPSELARQSGDWGHVEQSITVADHELTLHRTLRFERPQLTAAELLEVRTPLNDLRSPHARTLLVQPG
jgi:hypothetical protein